MIPLALAAHAAGHEVLFATTSQFHQALQSFGLSTASAGIGFREASVAAQTSVKISGSKPEEQSIIARARAFGFEFPLAFAQDLGSLIARVRPGIIVYGAGNFGGCLAAKLAGVPGVCHGYGRVNSLDEPLREQLGACADDIGVELPESQWPGLGDYYLDVYPSSLQNRGFASTGNVIPVRPVPVSEPGNLPPWVFARNALRPLVYLTLGTVFGAAHVFREAIEGLASLNVDVLVATGPTVKPEALGSVPPNVRVEQWVPQAELLPHVDLVVHHGGSGTTLGALSFGLPQLLLPHGADQFSNAEAVVTAGAGECLLKEEIFAEAVATKATSLLTEQGCLDAARALGGEIALMPAPFEILPLLAKHADSKSLNAFSA
jgi:UDP:flavonoid glycosyltransferase YjiC (YdhE family)